MPDHKNVFFLELHEYLHAIKGLDNRSPAWLHKPCLNFVYSKSRIASNGYYIIWSVIGQFGKRMTFPAMTRFT